MPDLSLSLPDGRTIEHCSWRLQTFLERDAYADFDYASRRIAAADDVITMAHVFAMNSVMRARSSRAAWSHFTDRPLSELDAIPTTLDLIDGSEESVQRGFLALGRLVELISAQKHLTDMAASKVLFLKRPRFVGISDSYVRAGLGINEWRLGQPAETQGFYAARMLAVERALRELGRRNQTVLRDLMAYVDEIGSVTPLGGGFKGQRIPAELSKIRILDILLWTEVAIHGPSPHQYWSQWYRTEVKGT